MFLLGLLAFFQTTFIPGFLLLKYTGFSLTDENGKVNKIRQLVYAFGLSLLINYLLVFVFTATGIYKPLTLYIILAIEGLLLFHYWKYRSSGSAYIKLDFRRYATAFRQFTSSNPLPYNLLLFISFAVILWYVFLFFYFMGGVFEHWDPVTGWNRFAVDWANNRLPTDTCRYPQLIPTNWSISYRLMQTTGVQAFAKAIMPLFSIGILLLFLESALRKDKAVYLLQLIFYGVFLQYLYDPSFIVSGYVDIATSFFGFLAFHALYSQEKEHEKKNRPFTSVWLAVIFASAAAVTKQAGLYILVVITVWSFMSLYKSRKIPELRSKKIISMILLLVLSVVFIVLPWYMLKEVQILRGLDRSEIKLAQRAHHEESLPERLVQGIGQIAARRHQKLKILVYAGMLLILVGFFHKKSRYVTLFIVIPYSLLWGFFFSYDTRNLAFAVPFMAYSAAFGASHLKRILRILDKLPSFKIPLILLIVLLLVGLAALDRTLFRKENLIRQQTRRKMKMGDVGLNDLLYKYHENEGLDGKIATDYQHLKYLPGLSQFYWHRGGRVTMKFLEFLETPEGKEIHYLLVPRILKSEKDVYQRYQENINSGRYRLEFTWRGYLFIKVK